MATHYLTFNYLFSVPSLADLSLVCLHSHDDVTAGTTCAYLSIPLLHPGLYK